MAELVYHATLALPAPNHDNGVKGKIEERVIGGPPNSMKIYSVLEEYTALMQCSPCRRSCPLPVSPRRSIRALIAATRRSPRHAFTSHAPLLKVLPLSAALTLKVRPRQRQTTAAQPGNIPQIRRLFLRPDHQPHEHPFPRPTSSPPIPFCRCSASFASNYHDHIHIQLDSPA